MSKHKKVRTVFSISTEGIAKRLLPQYKQQPALYADGYTFPL